MKVLLINGSTHAEGSTYTALKEVEKSLKDNGIETELIQSGINPIKDCIGCCTCRKSNENKCVFKDDIVNEIIEKSKDADGFIFGSPVYYAHPSAHLLSLLDRVFFAGKEYFQYKPAASVLVARRAGTVASFDVINKYFTISNMPIVSSCYWNNVFGANASDIKQDEEGLFTMRNLGANMAWILKSIEAGKKSGITHPVITENIKTNFIR